MKFCRKCKLSKEIFEFTKNVSKQDGVENSCRECRRAHMRAYYAENSAQRMKINKEAKSKRKLLLVKKVAGYLMEHPCVDCGESDIIVLDFDHLRDKKHNISYMINEARPWVSIQEEMNKCVIRCSNCHRRKTAREFSYARLAVLVE